MLEELNREERADKQAEQEEADWEILNLFL